MDFTKFNKIQEECIKTINNNLQIVACAGSGKTKTIVGRSIHILEQKKATPDEMVAITFTEKAAGEMKDRIYKSHEKEFNSSNHLPEMYIGTIHGFCLRQLQKHTNVYKKYEVLTDVQERIFINKNISYQQLQSFPYRKKNGEIVNSLNIKNSNLLLEVFNFIIDECLEISIFNNEIINFYNYYIELLSDNNYFTFSTIQNTFLQELDKNKNLIEEIKKIKYITVDEYQDTNTIQERILLKIVEINPNINICVVGDDDQTLYSWRGSNLELFSHFKNVFPNVKVKKLTTNYRSSIGIVETGKCVVDAIEDNFRIEKDFHCDNTFQWDRGDIILKTDFESIHEENRFIVDCIKKLNQASIPKKNNEPEVINYSNMAILVDSTKTLNKYNSNLLQLLDENGIEYIIDGTKQLFETDEIIKLRDLFLYFAKQYCNYKRKTDYINNKYENLIQNQDIIDTIKKYSDIVNDNKNFEATIQEFFFELTKNIELYKSTKANDRHIYNLGVFTKIIDDFERIHFLDNFGYRINKFVDFLIFDAPNVYPEGWLSPKFSESKCLKIMTIYASKGLEFPVVFLPHLCKNFLFPTQPKTGMKIEGLLLNQNNQIDKKIDDILSRYENKKNDDNLNRLFYVAITRCKKHLIMTKSKIYYKKTRKYDKKPRQLELASNSRYCNSDGKILLNKLIDTSTNKDTILPSYIFDFSTLKDIFECPMKFKFSTIYSFHSPLNVRMGYGKSLHNMLDDLHSTYLKSEIIKSYSDLKIHLNLPLAPKNGQLIKDMNENANKIITKYINQNKSNFDQISYVEAPIDYKLNDMIFINGTVDLIRNLNSGDVKIIDFKSNKKTLPDDIRKKQLLIYALGYKKMTDKTPTSVISYNLKENISEDINIEENDLAQINIEIKEKYHMIKDNNYPKNISFMCNECDFKYICKNIK